ncbi:hypothetical protein GCM10011378_16820 [Hymenobacter glacieicola]|uniref:Uncharacterized protein n=1 Tax=Hymenobacter glacieicola TaxID=1562124 RepID=A0ABQ1WQH4_9BACT|nr:hypothetical protein GCM10011378_16820 [Hymenobacter glacieicola]
MLSARYYHYWCASRRGYGRLGSAAQQGLALVNQELLGAAESGRGPGGKN